MHFRTETISADELARNLEFPNEIVSLGVHFAHATQKLPSLFSARDEAIMDRYLQRLPTFDCRILEFFKAGKKYGEIAAQLGTDEDSVRRSLVQTYADIRVAMFGGGGGSGDGEPSPVMPLRDRLSTAALQDCHQKVA